MTVRSVDEQLEDLRQAVLAMAIALGAGLPSTPQVIRSLNLIADVNYPRVSDD